MATILIQNQQPSGNYDNKHFDDDVDIHYHVRGGTGDGGVEEYHNFSSPLRLADAYVLENWIIIGSGNGLMPVPCQAIAEPMLS